MRFEVAVPRKRCKSIAERHWRSLAELESRFSTITIRLFLTASNPILETASVACVGLLMRADVADD